MTATTPTKLDSAKRDQAGDVLASAFLADPAYAVILPDQATRQRLLSRLFRGVVAHSLVHGEIYTTDDIAGVACWLRPGRTDLSVWQHAQSRFVLWRAIASFDGASRSRWMAFLECADRLHRQTIAERPHWYLLALGVQPASQGTGIGGQLIKPIQVRSSAESVPCYLETQSERNVRFYERRGFRAVGDATVPGLGVPIWAMIREPGPATIVK